MKKHSGKILLVIVALLTVALISACSGNNGNKGENSGNKGENNAVGQEKLVLKIANITKADSQFSKTLENIGEELKKQTNGRITAEYFPGGQLGNESDMMQQLNTGSIDIATITTAQLSSSSPAFGAWLMPFPVETHEQAYKLWTSEESMSLFDTLTEENVVGLGYSSSGFRFMLTTKPITSVDDLKGFKIRTTPSPTILDYWNGLKASPTPMPLTEVYTSLQTGVINGVDIDTESLTSEKLTEIAKHMTPDKHMYWAGGILINKDLWNKFSKEDQALIQEIVLAKTKENSETVAKHEEQLMKEAKSKYGLTVHELKRDEFETIAKKIREDWTKKSPEIGKFLEKATQIKSE